MSWRDKMRPGSFRGVPFVTDGSKAPVGRRSVTHEYPGRNIPYVEDMGRVTREHKVTAFVIGADCLDKADALLKALETEGEGELVHPWLGTRKVKAGVGEMSHAYAEGGMVRFELTFTETDEVTFPAAKANTGKLASASGKALAEGGLSRFESAMATINSAQISVSQMMKGATGMFGVLSQYAGPIAAAIGTAQGLASMLVNAPFALTGMIRGVLASVGGAFHMFDGFGSALSSLFGKTTAVSQLAALPAPQGEQAGALHVAAVRLIQDMMLADTVTEIGEVPVTPVPSPPASVPPIEAQVLQPVERPEIPVANDILQVRDTVTEAIWQQGLTAPLGYYQLLADARIQTGRHLVAVARAGVRLATVTPAQSLPALVLAYARYGDATRAGEIVTRNRVPHPGFLPAAPLQVAAK